MRIFQNNKIFEQIHLILMLFKNLAMLEIISIIFNVIYFSEYRTTPQFNDRVFYRDQIFKERGSGAFFNGNRYRYP